MRRRHSRIRLSKQCGSCELQVRSTGLADFQVKNCRLVGLLDLNQASPSVRAKIVAYLNKLVDYGVAGFRHDASKHMWPADILNILNDVKDLRADVR